MTRPPSEAWIATPDGRGIVRREAPPIQAVDPATPETVKLWQRRLAEESKMDGVNKAELMRDPELPTFKVGEPETVGAPVNLIPEPIDERAVNLLDLAEWLSQQPWSEFAVSLAAQYRDRGTLSVRQVAAAQSMREKVEARNARRLPSLQGERQQEVPMGLYRTNAPDYSIIRVVWNQDRTSQYCKGFDVASGTWEYVGKRPIAGIVVERDRLTAAQAGEYGRQTGMCMMCGRTLTDPNSIAAGIGPVCAGRV